MSTKTLKCLADEYFYSINSLARKIGEDVSSTKDAYEGLWNTLSVKEQNQAIDETIIQPEVALKYAIKKSDAKELPDYYPKLRIQTGLKYVIDETGSTLRWKDEHSAPFSFMTQSQMNLNIFDDSSQTTKNSSQNFNSYLIDSPRFSNSMQIQRINDISDDGYDSSNQLSFYQTESHPGSVFFKGESVLPKADDDAIEESLDTPDSYNSFQSSHNNKETEIPKTGFEFLDNW